MSTQLLFYASAVPVNSARHADCSVEVKGYAFCRNVNSVPLMAVEFPMAAPEYPVVFATSEDAVTPVAILGMRDKENLFVSEEGTWQAKYVPAFVRRYPFVFSAQDDGKSFVLCVDEDFSGFNREGRGQRLFTDDKKVSPYVDNVLKFLQEFRNQFMRTQTFCKKLKELGLTEDPVPTYTSAKEVVLPFIKFRGVDILLGPEMRSTGEVMGIDRNMGLAFAKSQIAAGNRLPSEGTVFLSLNKRDKENMGTLGQDLQDLGFKFLATDGTAARLREQGLDVEVVYKVGEGRPNVVDKIINGEVAWIINTPMGAASKYDERAIRRTALEHGLPTMPTLAAARAGVQALRAIRDNTPAVMALQDYHATLKRG